MTDVVIAYHTLHIQPRTAAHHRAFAATADFLKGFEEIVLIAIEIIFRAGFDDVDQVVGYRTPLDAIFAKVLARAQIHAPIHLTGVSTDDLCPNMVSKRHGKRGFAAGRGADHRHKIEIRKRRKC